MRVKLVSLFFLTCQTKCLSTISIFFMLSNYTKTYYYVMKARVLFLFTWVHYTRRMSTGIVDPQPWSEIRIYLPDSLLDWRERDVHSYDCDWIMKFGEHELNLKPHAQMLLITNEQECSHTLYTCRTLHARLLTYSHKK